MESNLTSIGGVVNSKEYSMQGGSCQRQVKCQAQGNLHEIAWGSLEYRKSLQERVYAVVFHDC